MPIFELPIKHTYVPKWGSWECIREAMQNGLDEADRGNALTVEHTGQYLRIFNRGAVLDVRALIIGQTDKADDERMRGTHGEGLGLCFLSGLRAGYEITVHTPSHVWKPAIEFSQTYGEKILMVKTRKKKMPFEGVEIQIGIPKETWDDVRKLFMSLREFEEDDIIQIDRGSILLDSPSRGMIYVKGIFVQKRQDLRYGYDLKQVKLDRDRSIVDNLDLQFELSKLYGEAIKRKSSKKLVDKVYGMLVSGSEDVRGMQYYSMPNEVKQAVADKFLADHGEHSVPVRNMAESEEMDHVGRPGVIVNDTLGAILKQTKVDTPEKVKLQNKGAVALRYSWQELSQQEQRVLKEAVSLVEGALKWATLDLCAQLFLSESWVGSRTDIMGSIHVVDFISDDVEGTSDSETYRIQISKKSLRHVARALRVIIHETSHQVFPSAGLMSHGRISEELWALVKAFEDSREPPPSVKIH